MKTVASNWFLAAIGALALGFLTAQYRSNDKSLVIAPEPHPRNNGELQQLPTDVFAGVWRLGYATNGDAPPLRFIGSNSPCALNGGRGDGASQVPSADGKCWLAIFPADGIDVRQFGINGTNDQTAVLAAINAAPTANVQEVSEQAPGYSNSMKTARNVVCPAGFYRFNAVLTIPPIGDFTLKCREGVVLTGPGGTADTVHITGATRATIELPTIYATGTGCAVHLEGVDNVGVLDNTIRIAGIVNPRADQTGKGLCLSPGSSANHVYVEQGIWGFDHCVDVTNTDWGNSGGETNDANWFDLGYLRACNVGIFEHGAPIPSGNNYPINANHWRANLDSTVDNSIGLKTNAYFEEFVLDVGNFSGNNGSKIVQLDAGAGFIKLRTLPSLFLDTSQAGHQPGTVLVDNSGTFTNSFAPIEGTLAGSSQGTALTAATTFYFGPGAQSLLESRLNVVSVRAVNELAFRALVLDLSADPGRNSTVTATLMVNGLPTALTCMVVGNGSNHVDCFDDNPAHFPTVLPQQRYALRVQTSGSIAANVAVRWSVRTMQQ